MNMQTPPSAALTWVWTGVASACGSRAENQDRVHADAQILAVFDGVSGRPLGGVAAAVGLGQALASAAEARARGTVNVGGALQAASQAVYEVNRRVGLNTATTGTLIALYSVNDELLATVGWIGDTAAFLVRGDGIMMLTRPHLRLDPDDRAAAPRISRWLGDREEETGLPDTMTLPVTAEDRLIVTSDGVTDVLSESTIGGIVAGAISPQAAADQLVTAALELGTSDNSTAAVAFLTRDSRQAQRGAAGAVAVARAEATQPTDSGVGAPPVRQPAATDTIQEGVRWKTDSSTLVR